MPETAPFKFRPDHDLDKNGNTNSVRAGRAQLALNMSAKAAGFQEGDYDPCWLQDLLCDLQHLCDRDERDFADTLDSATRCYLEER